MGREFEIRREVELEATAEEVWEAIATPAGLATWFMPMPVDADSDAVAAWEPGERLLVRIPAGADGSTQAFEYLIEAREGGSTVLRFVHSGFLGEDWDGEYEGLTGAGWDLYLHTLATYFRHFRGRAATYVTADGPPSSADARRWPRLSGALGLTQPVEPGAEVHLALPGAGSLDGVVDYVTPNFVGVRTTGALIRFHGRWPLGMTAAVSHHAYTTDFDAAAARDAWTAWLARAFD